MEINGSMVECRRADTDQLLYRFYILDAPSPSSLPAYVKELQRHKVSHLVRVCGPTYNSDVVERSGIHVHGWPFDDGAPPTQHVIDSWLQLLDSERAKEPPTTIAVHCVAGLGRAPILVAVAMVEYGGVPALDAIGHVREKRKGAINQVQLNWLMRYKPRHHTGGEGGEQKWACSSCMLM
mmetsp:Transcript_59315/g.68683  ORF Transcript_59315/g.68683 Transcript_59315/m.68683 type:complete len:180 (-) Transcript_59315:534-1073(-)